MGKICAFYSPLHGQCGTTATMVAAAFALEKEGFSVILVHSQSSYADLENMFFTKETKKNTFYDGIGLDGLCYTIKAGELTKADLDRAVVPLEENLYLLPSAAKRTDPEREEILRYIITEKLPVYYDYVFVDTGSNKSDISEAIRQAADIKIAIIAQNRTTLREFSEADVILCGNYDRKRKLNLKSLKKKYKVPVFAIPYCSAFADAIEDSSVRQFFLTNETLFKKVKSGHSLGFRKISGNTHYFFSELNTLSEYVTKLREKRRKTLSETGEMTNG